MVTKRIAIIPARGGSKRIPNKNISLFQGKPMIAWTIEAALESKCFERILVSTDDQQIASVAKEYGAEVPFLRSQYSDDFSPVSEATILALQQAVDYWKEDYGEVVQLMANCPLRTAEDIYLSIDKFSKLRRELQISCFKYGWMNPWWAVTLNSDGLPKNLFPDTSGQRSQDLAELYCPTGAIWIAKTNKLIEYRTFYGPGHAFEPMAWQRAVDIDDYDDLNFANAVFKQINS